MLKRFAAFILASVSLLTLVGCKKNSTPLIENEQDAKEVIECSKDNMFGLEKIAIFEDHVVVILDKKTCDNFEYDEKDHGGDDYTLEGYVDEKHPGFELIVHNMVEIWPAKDMSSIEVKNKKYVITVGFENKEEYKEDPDEDFEILGIDIGAFTIWFYDDTVELRYIARGHDIMWYYKQDFDRKKGQWKHVDEKEVGCGTEPEEG